MVVSAGSPLLGGALPVLGLPICSEKQLGLCISQTQAHHSLEFDLRQVTHFLVHPFFFSVYCLKHTHMPGAGAQACNPSYSGGRDQEDHGLEPARANSS
jgi:hypothetical protein